MNRLDWALEHAARGWLVFPLYEITATGICSCGLKCETPGKHPRVRDWQGEATGNDAIIRGWWAKWPQANIGILTGERSDLWVLDIDTRRSVELANGTLGPEGAHTLAGLEDEHDTLPDTRVAATGAGGEHHYFSYPGPGDFGNRVGFAPSLDIRANGGYVVGPGSNHLSGHQYEWAAAHDLVPPPEWLVTRAYQRRDRDQPELSGLDQGVGEGGRNHFLTRWAGAYRGIDGELDEFALFDLLWRKNEERCDPPLDESEVRKIARSAMRFATNEPAPEVVLEDGELRAPPEIPEGADLAWSIAEFMRLDLVPPQPLVHDLLDAGTGIMIAGPGGIGKSWLVMHLALAVATGTPFLDHWDVEQGPVLFIDEEGHPYGDQERFRMLINGHEIGSLTDTRLFLSVGKGLKLDTALGLATLRLMLERYKPRLVIFDSLVRVSSGDESKSREMANFFAIADEIKRTTGTAFCFVHHCRKPGSETPADLGDLVRGSSEIKNWLDTLFLALPTEVSTDMEVHVNKQRWKKKLERPFTVRLLTREDTPWARLGYQGEAISIDRSRVTTRNRIMAVVQELIKADAEPTAILIAARVDLGLEAVRGHLNQLVAMDLLIKTKSGTDSSANVYRPTEDGPLHANGRGGLLGPNGLLN